MLDCPRIFGAAAAFLVPLLLACAARPTTVPRPDPEPEPGSGPYATISLVLLEPLKPGTTVDLGVRFIVRPGWHIYWNGRNDSGEAPRIVLDLPEGITAGQTLWPVPVRHVLPGGILDHIYEKEVTLLVPLTVSQDMNSGTPVRITAECSWMVCSDVCVLEKGRASLERPVGVGPLTPHPQAEVEAIRAARAALPRPLPRGAEAVTIRSVGEGTDAAWEIRAKGGTVIEFYPGRDCAELLEPIADTRAEADRLLIRTARAQHMDEKALTGVVGVWTQAGSPPAYYEVNARRER